MTRAAIALRVAAFGLGVLCWSPSLVVGLAGLAWHEAAFNIRMAQVRRLRRAERLDDGQAALDRLRRGFPL